MIEITEGKSHRIVTTNDRTAVFPKHETSGQSPPPELLAEVQRNNAAVDRQALTTPFPSPFATAQSDLDRSLELEARFAPLLGMIFEEINPPKNSERILFELNCVFPCIRNNVEEQASHRADYILKVGVIPYVEIEPEPPQHEIRGGKRRQKSAPLIKVEPTREKFPLAFFAMHSFLKTHKPVSPDIDLSVLRELCAMDEGRENEPRPVKEKPPSLSELQRTIAGLTALVATTIAKPKTA
jgi:hypothetical protein